ncbi:MAG: carboxypeptidase regulatory-like domain-containing protein, partial [Planctomycetota bacterium]|nr:carboxypeptidase regulatory-like domain-containing protein [Planctomycetota bacterium]
VYANDYTTNQPYGGGYTNSDGFYSISGLAAGAYRVAVSTWGTEFAQEYYDNIFDYWQAVSVNVSASGVTQNINFGLSFAGSITGIVHDVNGSPINGILINAHCEALNFGRNDYTDENGFYEMTGLPSGAYRVELATWDASSGNYIKQYYNHTIRWEQATLVHVQPGQEISGIDFDLMEGASLSGYVKDTDGIGVENTEIVSFIDGQWYVNVLTDTNGFYKFRGLVPEADCELVANPPDSTDYTIARIFVNIAGIGDYNAPDIYLQAGALKVSGRVIDKSTSQPLAGVRVGCYFNEIDLDGGSTQTDIMGQYTLANLLPGEYLEIWTEPPSQYARIGAGIKLEHNISNLDFSLPAAATLSGKVINADTAEPIADVEIEYGNDRYNCWMSGFSDIEGRFSITSLPDGIAEVMARPTVASGYGWSLPWGSSWVYLDEGQHKSDRIIALHRGALVKGNVKYADNSSAAHIEVSYQGTITEGWTDTDANGRYEIILPPGKYVVATDYDEDELSSLPIDVMVTDQNQTIILPDLVAYDDSSGQTISGYVTSSIGSPAPGILKIEAFLTGAIPAEPNNIKTIKFMSGCALDGSGSFEITALPPDANYDVCLFVIREDLDGIESVAMRDAAANIAPGSTGINLSCDSSGATITGTVVNTYGSPVLGASVVLNDTSGGAFGGLGDVNENGGYTIYNIAPGTYTATATHSKYINASTTIIVTEGATVEADTIVLPFTGDKEGPDLNGDGVIDVPDVAEFSEMWLDSGLSEADFNQDNNVGISDWVRIAENWLGKAIWYQ